jgi:hypothetical protein
VHRFRQDGEPMAPGRYFLFLPATLPQDAQ